MLGLYMDRAASTPLPQQLTRQLAGRILRGGLPGGTRLPATRDLARELGVARNVVIQAYEQLHSEGYVVGRVGSGTYVADLPGLPWARPASSARAAPAPDQSGAAEEDRVDFHVGNPDAGRFPRAEWARILRDVCLTAGGRLYSYGAAEGEPALRSAIADYLLRAKGLAVRPDQIVIVAGTAQAIDLLARLLNRDAADVAVEDPGFGFCGRVFESHGARVHPIPVDSDGLQTRELPVRPRMSLVYVVPSHQFPVGGVLPLARRLDLLEYARANEALIVEDDYDSEYRYDGEPVQPLHLLDPSRVVHVGSFSKTFSPALRLGFMIVPGGLCGRIRDLKESLNIRTPALEQLALARFIASRAFDRHVLRMKRHYAAKRAHLLAALTAAFGSRIRVSGQNAGLHVFVEFLDREFGPAAPERWQRGGVIVDWVESYALEKGRYRNCLVLGYGNLERERIDEGVRRLAGMIG